MHLKESESASENQSCPIRFPDLSRGHEDGEDEDEGALRYRQPADLLQGEEDGSVQTGFGRAAGTRTTLEQGGADFRIGSE